MTMLSGLRDGQNQGGLCAGVIWDEQRQGDLHEAGLNECSVTPRKASVVALPSTQDTMLPVLYHFLSFYIPL